MVHLILVIVRWVVSLWHAGWCLWTSYHAIMGKTSPVWAYAVLALGAIMLIAANFGKIRGSLNLALASLVLIHIAAWFTYAKTLNAQLWPLLLTSVIIYLLFYFSRGK